MADLNRHLKNNKILVFFTIFAFLYMSCFSSCSKLKSQEKSEVAQKSLRTEKGEANELPTVETASSPLAAESDKTTQSDKNDDPCAGCPPGVNASGQKKRLSEEELNMMGDKLDRYFQALEEAVEEIPRDTFDPQAIVDEVGDDPKALFRWVRDNTYFVPYRGSLRGYKGVLMDRLVNSLVRSLLLHELLEEQAKDLLRRIRPVPREGALKQKVTAPQETNNIVDNYIEKYELGLDRDEILRALKETVNEQEEITKKLNKQIDSQTEYIFKAVDEFRKDSSPDEEIRKRKAIQNHWWVQIENENKWSDLDPALADSKPGKSLAEEEQNLSAEDLPEDMNHLIQISIIIERWQNGKTSEQTVLEHVFHPSALSGEQIILYHIPLKWPKDLNLFAEKKPLDRLLTEVLNQKEWQPALVAGSDRISQSSFTDSGEINESPGSEEGGADQEGFITGIFKASDQEKEKKKPVKDSFLTAEWIEYEIHSPEQSIRKIRRTIFDMIGTASRKEGRVQRPQINESARMNRGLALLGETEILFQNCHISPYHYVHFLASSAVQNSGPLLSLFHRPETSQGQIDESVLEGAIPPPSPVYNLALYRQILNRFRGYVYLDEPNILSYSKGLRQHSKEGMTEVQEFDIVTNKVAILPGSSADPFFVQSYQGVIDSNAESSLLSSSKYATKLSTAEIFVQSQALNIKWQLIKNSQELASKGIMIEKDSFIPIEKDLSEGYFVLVPEKSILIKNLPFTSWWRINPKTGEVLGITQAGKGQASVEERLQFAFLLSPWAGYLVLAVNYVKCLDGGGNEATCLKCGLAKGFFAQVGYYGIIISGPAMVVGLILFGAEHITDFICP